MNQQALEKYLWGAATLLRGTIDAGDWRASTPRSAYSVAPNQKPACPGGSTQTQMQKPAHIVAITVADARRRSGSRDRRRCGALRGH